TSPVYVQQWDADNPFNGIGLGPGRVHVGDYTAPALGDVDGDGDRDLVVGEQLGALFYFKNTGAATIPVYVQQTGADTPFCGFSPATSGGPALGEVDGDGDLEAVVGERVDLFYFRANRAPVVDNAIPDQTFTGPGVHSYAVPANTFLDLDNNALTYSAT